MKKEILIPTLIILLGVIFVFINIMVFFTKGSSWFVKKKLKVGALILTLTSIAACHTVPRPTCYYVAETNGNDTINKIDSKDSIVKKQPLNTDTIRVTCYEMVAPQKDIEKKK